MCVDDYQFRHPSARREKLCRRFMFFNEEGGQRVFLVNISQFQFYGDLCLCEILLHLNKKGLSIKDYQFQLPQLNIVIEAGDRCRIPFDTFTKKEIPINMHKIYQNHEYEGQLPEKIFCSDDEDQNQNHSDDDRMSSQFSPDQCKDNQAETKTATTVKLKKKRTVKTKEHEKTVRQALEKTKHWRHLHERQNLSLKNAALIVGLSKKTLDDYFLVIRVGQLHGYDFKSNLDKKIGHLRGYIKSQSLKIRGRLSKNVDCFKLIPDPLTVGIVPSTSEDKLRQINEQYLPQKMENEELCPQHICCFPLRVQ